MWAVKASLVWMRSPQLGPQNASPGGGGIPWNRRTTMETPFFMDGMYVMGEIKELSTLTSHDLSILMSQLNGLEVPREHLAFVPLARVSTGDAFITIENLVIDKRKISARVLGRYNLTETLPFGELEEE